MLSRLLNAPARALRLLRYPQEAENEAQRLGQRLDDIAFGQGRLWAAHARSLESPNLQDYEFKVFSQFGEDGIIQRLVNSIPIANRTFIEFGVEDFSESNCRFLMAHDNWSGFTIDGSPENVARTRASSLYWRHDLNSICAFVTRENVGELLRGSGFGAEPGILSIDVDGVDYHLWAELDWMRPAIMIAEYNSVFGPDRAITVPYDPQFTRFDKHHSNLYFGCSLAALDHLARQRGYSLVGSTSQGVNAFFVRNDLLSDRIRPLSVAEAYTVSKHRESRDAAGRLTFVGGAARIELIRGLPVVNVVTGETEAL